MIYLCRLKLPAKKGEKEMIQFKINRKKLVKTLEILKKNINKKNDRFNLPVLKTVCMDIFKDRLDLTTVNFDQKKSVTLSIPVQTSGQYSICPKLNFDQKKSVTVSIPVQTSGQCSICINLNKLLKVLKMLSDEDAIFQIEIEEYNIKIISMEERISCDLGGIMAEDFPRIS